MADTLTPSPTASSTPTSPTLALNSMFSDYAVLQRDMPIPVWGRGVPGAEVVVEIASRSATAVVGADGRWRAELPAISSDANADGPHTLAVKSSADSIERQGILFGEVWLCSGQSNMQWTVQDSADAEREMAAAAQYADNVRLYLAPKMGFNEPQEKLMTRWKKCSPENVADFSAVAYFFASELRALPQFQSDAGDVPIGLIDSSYGGTVVEAWMSAEYLAEHFPGEELHDSFFGFKPCAMYNGMIAPIVPYAIRGVLWYQGESNCEWPEQYERLFPGMIDHWRELWSREDLPFLFVQIASLSERFGTRYFTLLREAQAEVARKVPHTAMAVALDTCEGLDLHPKYKREVGRRLSLLARRDIYGEPDLLAAGPTFRSMKIEGDRVRVSFDNVGGGLVDRDDASGNFDRLPDDPALQDLPPTRIEDDNGTRYYTPAYRLGGGNHIGSRGDLRGFQIAGADGRFLFAKAEIDGDDVIVSHPLVPEPHHVRYAFVGNPEADLYNREGLPAAPFRTDDLEYEEFELERLPMARRIGAPTYEAVVEGDGCLTSLKVDGEELLDASFFPSRGIYFNTFWGPSRMFHVTEIGPRLLHAQIEASEILYEFGEDSILITAKNRSPEKLPFQIVLAPGVELGRDLSKNGDDAWLERPAKASCERCVWLTEKARLEIEGVDTLATPHEPGNQVVQATLAPGERRSIVLRFSKPSEAELEKLREMSPPKPAAAPMSPAATSDP